MFVCYVLIIAPERRGGSGGVPLPGLSLLWSEGALKGERFQFLIIVSGEPVGKVAVLQLLSIDLIIHQIFDLEIHQIGVRDRHGVVLVDLFIIGGAVSIRRGQWTVSGLALLLDQVGTCSDAFDEIVAIGNANGESKDSDEKSFHFVVMVSFMLTRTHAIGVPWWGQRQMTASSP